MFSCSYRRRKKGAKEKVKQRFYQLIFFSFLFSSPSPSFSFSFSFSVWRSILHKRTWTHTLVWFNYHIQSSRTSLHTPIESITFNWFSMVSVRFMAILTIHLYSTRWRKLIELFIEWKQWSCTIERDFNMIDVHHQRLFFCTSKTKTHHFSFSIVVSSMI